MDNETDRLKEELLRARSQLYVFYELTKAMRTTLRLDEITYIILTGLTAQQGLGFNRAVILLADEEEKNINGFMGLGSMDNEESSAIWHSIEEEKKDLYALIDNYQHIKKDDSKAKKFIDFVRSLSFNLSSKESLATISFYDKNTLHVKENENNSFKNDPLVKKLNLGNFLISSLWIKGRPKGIVVVDNYVTKNPITDDDLKIFDMFVEQAAGAIENSQAFEKTLTKAHTDSLTLLWNYGYFQYRLDEELTKAKTESLALSVMMIDIDDFKKFNDAYGHIQGDNALKIISGIFKESCRKIDITCRYGGEEFAVILPASNKEEALHIGKRILKSTSKQKILNNRFTVSIGIASFPQDSTNKEILIEKSDQALYEAKRRGKNRIILS